MIFSQPLVFRRHQTGGGDDQIAITQFRDLVWFDEVSGYAEVSNGRAGAEVVEVDMRDVVGFEPLLQGFAVLAPVEIGINQIVLAIGGTADEFIEVGNVIRTGQ